MRFYPQESYFKRESSSILTLSTNRTFIFIQWW